MQDINVGKKVQEYRQQRGMTCKDLATLAEITPSMLTQIEKAQANPSINTMKAIAQALDVPLYQFFLSDEEQSSLVVRKNERRVMGYPEQPGVRYELLMPNGNGTIEFCKMILSPKKTSSEKMFSHTGEEMACVLSGTATVVMEDMTYDLFDGDSIRIPPSTRHRWENHSDDTATVIFAVSPPSF